MSSDTIRAAYAAAALASTTLLVGCASDIMKNYVGRPVEDVIIDYGPPSTVLELGRDERAYQWRKVSTDVVAGSTSGEIKNTWRGARYEETVTPGYVQERECFYTFYARGGGKDWYVTSFRKPRLECE
ncbi:hypothetical protein FM996_16765 [Methylosinus sporium]|uniref:Lipoprotein n=1 Tax=Methylosinus sporium TaxID=428 RepID=A0A549SLA3_METSR|nr:MULTISPECIES: hypothetical protein [Methylosinus]OAI26426.1 hypothetical protein A1351_14945 [Methylosinus sp. R-45379]TDX60434.1 hypothetical protein EDE12_12131 [Methylosinus sp. sav-2]TRL30423.1 hypothetical protein FM996_16765 [Methylosinus sporium]